MSERSQPLGTPPQSDAQAANSATPDTETLPRWDDPDWEGYLWATDRDYRIEKYLEWGDEEAADGEMDDYFQQKMESGDWDDEAQEEYEEWVGHITENEEDDEG